MLPLFRCRTRSYLRNPNQRQDEPKNIELAPNSFSEAFDPCRRNREAKHLVVASIELSTEELVLPEHVVLVLKSSDPYEMN